MRHNISYRKLRSAASELAEEITHQIGKPYQDQSADGGVKILVQFDTRACKETQKINLETEHQRQYENDRIPCNLHRALFRDVLERGHGKNCHDACFHDDGDDKEDKHILDQYFKFHIIHPNSRFCTPSRAHASQISK